MKKNIAEKFDRLPQDFDQLAIWNGIERPKKYFMLRLYFLSGLLGSLALAILLFVFTQSEDTLYPDEEELAAKAISESFEREMLGRVEIDSKQKLSQSTAISSLRPKVEKEVSPYLDEKEKILSPILSPFKAKEKESKQASRKEEEILIQELNHTSPKQIDAIIHLEIQLPDELSLELNQNRIGQAFTNPSPKLNPRRSSISIRTGIGSHQAKFLSASEGEQTWRNRMEQSQLGYSIALRYEYLLKNDFLLSFSGNYQLYKANIKTSNLLDSMGQQVQINYDLYNHYHLFSGILEIGKRVHHETFFWDILGGVGIKFKQYAEVDYFIKDGELAKSSLLDALYQNSGHVFYSVQSSLGKHLTDRIFIRLGAQAYSAFNLTGPQSANRHQIIPFSTFLEAGLKF